MQFSAKDVPFKNKVFEVITDSGSSENVMSKTWVKAMGLVTAKHPKPYNVGWIKKGLEFKVTKICQSAIDHWEVLPSSSEVMFWTCMHVMSCLKDWQFDRDTIHRVQDITSFFVWQGKTIVLEPQQEKSLLKTNSSSNTPLMLHISGSEMLKEMKRQKANFSNYAKSDIVQLSLLS